MVWLAGWTRRRIKIVEGLTMADYEMKLIVHKGSGTDSPTDIYLDGHIKDNFSDLRFTGPDQITLISYWIESIIGTTPNMIATVWIKVPILTPINNIYIYYDNPSATSLSNGNNTFMKYIDNSNVASWIFDNFSGGAMPSITAGAGTSTRIYSMATPHALAYLPVSLPVTDFIFETRIISSNTSRIDQCIFMQTNGTYTNYKKFVWTEVPYVLNNTQFSIGGTFSFGTYYRLIQKIKTNNANGRTEIILNDNGTVNAQVVDQPLYDAVALGTPLTAVEIGKTGGISYGTDLTFDWMFYRKYVSPEPTFGVSGIEELNITAIAMILDKYTCPASCPVTAGVTWRNDGNNSVTFRPAVFVDNTTIAYGNTDLTITAGSTGYGLVTTGTLSLGTHSICPEPN